MEDDRFQVVIAGGGVAALEAVLAIRALETEPTSIELLSPSRDFRLQALSVAEPFGGDAQTLDLEQFCAVHDVGYRSEGVAEIWGGPQRILTDRGDELFYDALLMATGARRTSALPGSHPFRGAADVAWFGTLLERLQRGAIADVAFAVPRQVKWSLPIWELAMLTAGWLADRNRGDARISVVTHELAPVEVFGDAVSSHIATLLAERGVDLVPAVGVVRFDQGRLVCEGGTELRVDEVVSLPGLSVPEFPGVPQGRHGFIGCDAEMRVDGLERVWAAGDSTWFPIKQGGLAAQQAEIAAAGILRAAGAEIDVPPFRPVGSCAPSSPRTAMPRSPPARSGGRRSRSPDRASVRIWPGTGASTATASGDSSGPRTSSRPMTSGSTMPPYGWRSTSPRSTPARATTRRPCAGCRSPSA